MTHRLALAVMVGTLALAAVLATQPHDGNSVEAADPSKHTIAKIPAARLASGIRSTTIVDRNRGLTASVDQRICATIDLLGPSDTDSEGNKVLVVGTVEQPDACRRPAGTIDFTRSDGSPLFAKVPLRPRETQFLTNLAPEAIIDPEPRPSQNRGFLRATVTVSGEGLVKGSGRLLGQGGGASPSLLIVPSYTRQPLSVRDAIPFLYPLEEDGEVALVLPQGDYLVTYNNTDHKVAGATDSIRVQSSQLLTFPAHRISLERGENLRLDLTAVYDPILPKGPAITPPTAGDAGLR